MAINAADARQLAHVMLQAYGEDISTIASILRPLRVTYTTINWVSELSAVAFAYQPFLDSGLSILWWVQEVDRMSQP